MNQFTSNETCEINADGMLTLSPSPHIKHGMTTQRIMLYVIIALLPAAIWGIISFGIYAGIIMAVSVASSMFFEWATQKLLKKPSTAGDLSAAVTGLLLAMNLPSSVSILIPIVGSFVAIVIVKQLFGGIGKNFLNPALAARVFLFLSWSGQMANYPAPSFSDAEAYATPLASLKNGEITASIADMFLGKIGGCIGEVSALLLLIGGIFLIATKVITWHIPVSYLGTVALITFIFPKGAEMFDVSFMAAQLFSGGLMLGALFMATDYVTSPVTPKGRLIYGVGCGLLTVFFRYFSTYPEGVSFAILVMNTLVWYIEKITKPKTFGSSKKQAEVAK